MLEELGQIASKTNNDAIIIVIVIFMGVLLIGIPLYERFNKAQERKREQYLEQKEEEHKQQRERDEMLKSLVSQVMKVVEKNTESHSEYKEVIIRQSTLIELRETNCKTCKEETQQGNERIAFEIHDFAQDISNGLSEMKNKLDHLIKLSESTYLMNINEGVGK
jgi:predicted histidine transporter YuiF (NhaC family)